MSSIPFAHGLIPLPFQIDILMHHYVSWGQKSEIECAHHLSRGIVYI